MRPIVIVLLVVAVGIAGLTAFLAKRFLADQAAGSQAQVVTNTEKVLVAARDVRAGAVLIEEDLKYEDWPVPVIDKRFVVFRGGEDPKGRFIGSVASRPIAAGEPLQASAVFRQDEAGQMSARIGPGMRALALAIDPTNSVAGFVNPGDRVDIVLVTRHEERLTREEREAGNRAQSFVASEVVLSGVRVLAIDANVQAAAAAMPGKTATLELTPEQAEKVILAGETGKLHLVLRSQVDEELAEPGDTEVQTSFAVSRAVQTFSHLARKFGIHEDLEGAEPAEELFVSGRSVKINRAGYTVTQTFGE